MSGLFKPGRFRLCAFLLAVALIALAALRGFGIDNINRPEPPAPEQTATALPNDSGPDPAHGPPFEEPPAQSPELDIKQADQALLEALRALGLSSGQLEIIYVMQSESKLGRYACQRLALYPADPADTAKAPPAPEEIFAALEQSLARLAPQAVLDSPETGLLRIRIHDLATHEIRLVPPLTPRTADPQTGVPPRLAIVIDDMGESMRAADSLLALNYPVTFSIWPDSSHARAIAEAAHNAGREIIIHQPMEPLGHPDAGSGPNTLLLGQSREQIIRIVTASVNKVPYAVGINNHMGSRVTQDIGSMRAVLDALLALWPARPLFVLDSVTHPGSRLYSASLDAGLRAYRRDIFLDVEEDIPYILHQLDKAAQLARQHGQAVAIGHPLPGTLAALAQWQSRRDPGVLIVPLVNLH